MEPNGVALARALRLGTCHPVRDSRMGRGGGWPREFRQGIGLSVQLTGSIRLESPRLNRGLGLSHTITPDRQMAGVVCGRGGGKFTDGYWDNSWA